MDNGAALDGFLCIFDVHTWIILDFSCIYFFILCWPAYVYDYVYTLLSLYYKILIAERDLRVGVLDLFILLSLFETYRRFDPLRNAGETLCIYEIGSPSIGMPTIRSFCYLEEQWRSTFQVLILG